MKVLDFGLARIGDGLAPGLTQAPTIMRPTGEGLLLGTASYKSPEQAVDEPSTSGPTSGRSAVCCMSC